MDHATHSKVYQILVGCASTACGTFRFSSTRDGGPVREGTSAEKGTGTFPAGDEAGWVGHFIPQLVGRHVKCVRYCARPRA